MDARLNITAAYMIKAPTLELVATQLGSENANLYKQRVPFNVLLKITDKLFQPQLGFDIDLDENNSIVSQDVVSKVNNALTTLRENPSELNKQVFSSLYWGDLCRPIRLKVYPVAVVQKLSFGIVSVRS
ncbi:translocation/assembly module TamB domain-containing protein [Sphingobacterium sp. E70]|nr:translocation/assembly module TamB domain-containing protein [Sphingobacterium sp. E70]ULT22719.1 translocation/assembly module TamB domain-containing protein [Sphingobacterium sp. E70]